MVTPLLRAPRRGRSRRSFTLLDLIAALTIVMLLTLLATATMLTVLNTSKNDGATATALAAASDAVGLSAARGDIPSADCPAAGTSVHCAIDTGAAEVPDGQVTILSLTDNGDYTIAVYKVTPPYGGTAEVTITFPDTVGGTPVLGNPGGGTGTTVPGTPSTPQPAVTVNNYSSSGDTMTWSWAPSTGGTGPYTYYWSVSPSAGATCTSGSTDVASVTCSGVLQPVTLYTFSVFAQDSLGASSSVGTVSQVSAGSGTTTTAPGGTTTTLVQNPTTPDPYVSQNVYGSPNDTMSWSWDPSTGGEGGLIYYWSVGPATSGCSFGSTTSDTVTCSSLTPGTTYTFSVYASDGDGDASGVGTVTEKAATSVPTTTSPGTPTTDVGGLSTPVLSVGANNYGDPYDSINWDWTASSGGSGTISYFWSVSPTTSGCSFGETSSQSFTCSSAVAGTSYTYSVYAQDPSGDTSSIATITVVAAGPPSTAPTDAVAAPQPYVSSNVYNGPDSSVGFSWSAASGGSGGYTYYWSITDSSGNEVTGGATDATSAVDPSLSPGTYYVFSVYAVDTEGDTSSAGTVSVITASSSGPGSSETTTTLGGGGGAAGPTTPEPTVTVNSTPAGSSTGEMAWSWTPSSGGAGGYTYYWSVSPAACSGSATTATSASCSAMTPGVTYTFSVYSVDSSSTQSATGVTSAQQQEPSGSSGGSPVASAWGTAGTATATVSWADSASGITASREWVGNSSNCTSGIGSTTVSYSNSPTAGTEPVSLSLNLVAGQTYSAFASVTDGGVVTQSACVTFVPTVTAPGTPTTSTFTGGSGGGTVGWGDGGTLGITTVNVETYVGTGCSSPAHTASGSYTASNNTTSGTISIVGDYVAGDTYSAKVTAVYNSGGVSGPGNCVTYTVPGAPATTTTTAPAGPVRAVTLTYDSTGSNTMYFSWSYTAPPYGTSRTLVICYPGYKYDSGKESVAAGCADFTADLSYDESSRTDMPVALYGGGPGGLVIGFIYANNGEYGFSYSGSSGLSAYIDITNSGGTTTSNTLRDFIVDAGGVTSGFGP